MTTRRNLIQILISISLLLIPVFSTAIAAKPDSKYFLEGYDVVSYFDASGPVKGSGAHAVKYKGFTFAFANEKNANKFIDDPEYYYPAYDGNCAFGMVYGMKSSIDPLVWKIVDDRLFFLINQGTKKKWSRKSKKYIKKGDRNWNKIATN